MRYSKQYILERVAEVQRCFRPLLEPHHQWVAVQKWPAGWRIFIEGGRDNVYPWGAALLKPSAFVNLCNTILATCTFITGRRPL